MKYLILILLFSCTPAKDIQLTVTHIQEVNGKREVYARRGYQVWMATIPKGADSLKRGSTIRAGWTKERCEWVFIRVK